MESVAKVVLMRVVSPHLQHWTTFLICGLCKARKRRLRPLFGSGWSCYRCNYFWPEAAVSNKKESGLNFLSFTFFFWVAFLRNPELLYFFNNISIVVIKDPFG